MPISVCQGWTEIQSTSVRQLATRPDRMPSVAVKKNSVEPERRRQYMSAKAGKILQVSHVAAATDAARVKIRDRRRRRRWIHARTTSDTNTFRSEARE